jgi:hypothetical protein
MTVRCREREVRRERRRFVRPEITRDHETPRAQREERLQHVRRQRRVHFQREEVHR